MSYVDYEAREGIGYVTLNRPEVLNALSDDVIVELRERLFQLDDDADAQIGILSGAGRAFSSGADVRQRQLRPRAELKRLGGPQGRNAHLQDLIFRFTNWKPLIAAVHGYVMGAGLHIAFQCELIVAAVGTQFQITEIRRGVDGTAFWAMLVERGCGSFANDVALTGRFWDSEEGLSRGAVDRIASEGQHVYKAEELAHEIMSNPPLAVRAVVEARRRGLEEVEMRARAIGPRGLHLTEDFQESASAFIEKRSPVFHGQ